MQPPSSASGERRRLAAVHDLGLLDTPSEERFDRVTRLARALLDAPVAALGLIDERRVWLKSRQGLSQNELPREHSAFDAIVAGGAQWVEDTRDDERFAAHPLRFDGQEVRFHAAQALHVGQGLRVGALCVFDHQPREFSAGHMALLSDLARLAETELTSQRRRRPEVRLELERADRKDHIDSVTGAWNRVGIVALLEQALTQCREEAWPLTAILGQLRGNSLLSQTWTCDGGEIILTEVAQALRGCIRPYDALGRVGAEKFLLLLVDCAAEHAPGRVAALERKIASNVVLQALNIELDFGHSTTVPDDELDARGLIETVTSRLGQARRGTSAA